MYLTLKPYAKVYHPAPRADDLHHEKKDERGHELQPNYFYVNACPENIVLTLNYGKLPRPLTDAFFAQPQREVLLSVGKTLLPCYFRKVHYTVALFKTRKEALQKILTGTDLIPALKWGGHYMVALGLIRYTESDLGAYDEVILSVPSIPANGKRPFSNWADLVGPLANRRVGQYIFHIPVTSTFSEAAGRELWGYPKIVAQIKHDFNPGGIDSSVRDSSGKLILRCSGHLGFSIPSIPLSLITYSVRNGKKLRTEVKVRGGMNFISGNQFD